MSLYSTWPKKISNRIFGDGPWHADSFLQVKNLQTSIHKYGVHRAESFAGVLAEINPGDFFYEKALPVIPQNDISQRPFASRYLPHGLVCSDKIRLYCLSDAGVIGADCIIYCRHNRIAVLETVKCWHKPSLDHAVFGAVRFPGPKKLSGVSLSIGGLGAQGFYHFLLESLPKIWLARGYLEHVDWVLVSGQRCAIREEWLRLAGISPAKIRWLDGLGHYHCEQVIFSDLPMRDCQPVPMVRSALLDLFPFAREVEKQGRQLWISRSDASMRHVRWENALLKSCAGFEKITLTHLSPKSQIEAFAGSSVIAGPHGAGFANLVFAQGSGKLIELLPPNLDQPLYSRLAQISGFAPYSCNVDFDQYCAIGELADCVNNIVS